MECFKGLTEEDLKAYPVEPELQQNAETPQRNSPHAAPQSISILDIPAKLCHNRQSQDVKIGNISQAIFERTLMIQRECLIHIKEHK